MALLGLPGGIGVYMTSGFRYSQCGSLGFFLLVAWAVIYEF
jgi:hypothetical protein